MLLFLSVSPQESEIDLVLLHFYCHTVMNNNQNQEPEQVDAIEFISDILVKRKQSQLTYKNCGSMLVPHIFIFIFIFNLMALESLQCKPWLLSP